MAPSQEPFGNITLKAEDLAATFEKLPTLMDEDLHRRGAWFSACFRVGIGPIPFDLEILRGRLTKLERGPFLMRSCQFSISATEEAWLRFWKPIPEPGWHDIFALTKRGVARIEGDLQPLMANLQYVKDLLALPRRLAISAEK